MVGNLVVNAILAAVLYGVYLWTPWASLVLAALSLLAFGYAFLFDKEHTDAMTQAAGDRLSVLLGALISLIGVIASIVAVMK